MSISKIRVAALLSSVVCSGGASYLVASGRPSLRATLLALFLILCALTTAAVVVKPHAFVKPRDLRRAAQAGAVRPALSKGNAEDSSVVMKQSWYAPPSNSDSKETRIIPPPLETTRNEAEREEALQRNADEVSALRSDIASLRRLVDDRSQSLAEGVRAVHEAVSRWQEPPRSAALMHAVDSPLGPVDGPLPSDETIHVRLQELAVRCMSRGLSIRRVRDELPPDWLVEASEPNDIPDAFLVAPARNHDLWVVPNTREWLPFRDRGWFEVVGTDVVTARISRIDRLPRLTTSRKLRTRGSLEVTT